MKIAIDNGHGNNTAGKRTPLFSDGTFMREWEFNSAVAKELKKILDYNGFDCLLVSPEETDTSLPTRVRRANNWGADVYVSIHANAFGNDWNTANGVETFICDNTDAKTNTLGKVVQRRLIEVTKRRDRGLKTNDGLYVLNATRMPACLVECGFMTNLEEATLLRNQEYRTTCAVGIAKGICDYAGVEYKDMNGVVPKMIRYQKIEKVPKWYRPTIQKLLRSGFLFGDANGNLDLSEDMCRVFVANDRAGIYD